MTVAQVAFEYLLMAMETNRATAVNPPTHYLNMAGTLTPKTAKWRPAESRGTLAEYYRAAVVRKWAELSANGPADVYTLPLFLSMCVKGGVTPTTPGGGTNSRLWTFAPTMNADDLKSATMYFGDPNVQAFQAPFAMLDSIVLSGDASATGGVTQAVKGLTNFFAKTAPNSTPSMLSAPLLAPADVQVYLDTTSAIGTTDITSRVLSPEVTIPSGVTYKYRASGPTGNQQFTACGRKKRHVEAKVVIDLVGTTEYDMWAAATAAKLRIRWNGPVIESTLRYYIEVDVYGPIDVMDWGESEQGRTIACTILSQYDTGAGYDFAVKVQNDRATL